MQAWLSHVVLMDVTFLSAALSDIHKGVTGTPISIADFPHRASLLINAASSLSRPISDREPLARLCG